MTRPTRSNPRRSKPFPAARSSGSRPDSDGSRYEAHVTTDDGTEVVVKVDEDFEVTDTEERVAGCDGHHSGGPRPGSDDSYETTN